MIKKGKHLLVKKKEMDRLFKFSKGFLKENLYPFAQAKFALKEKISNWALNNDAFHVSSKAFKPLERTNNITISFEICLNF